MCIRDSDDVVEIRDQLAFVRSEAAEVGATRVLWSRLGLGAAIALVLFGIVKLAMGGRRSDPEPAAA